MGFKKIGCRIFCEMFAVFVGQYHKKNSIDNVRLSYRTSYYIFVFSVFFGRDKKWYLKV